MPHPIISPEAPPRIPLWLRRALLAGGIACLAIALLGFVVFVVFALRAVSIA